MDEDEEEQDENSNYKTFLHDLDDLTASTLQMREAKKRRKRAMMIMMYYVYKLLRTFYTTIYFYFLPLFVIIIPFIYTLWMEENTPKPMQKASNILKQKKNCQASTRKLHNITLSN